MCFNSSCNRDRDNMLLTWRITIVRFSTWNVGKIRTTSEHDYCRNAWRHQWANNIQTCIHFSWWQRNIFSCFLSSSDGEKSAICIQIQLFPVASHTRNDVAISVRMLVAFCFDKHGRKFRKKIGKTAESCPYENFDPKNQNIVQGASFFMKFLNFAGPYTFCK